tara:strand:+ start:16108 stop:18009 length:1902 start_codon:yes stop_codon:yes gene_type:complete
MAKLLKLRRGTTSQHSSFTGAEGEVTVDTTKDTLVVHDGSTAGGTPLAKEAGTVAEATNVTVTANNSTNETVYPVFVDGATGTQGVESDTGLTYNPSTGDLTIGGELDAATGDFSGNVDIDGNIDIDGTCEADAYTVNGTALDAYVANITSTASGTSTHVTVTDNESTNENNLITFVEDAATSSGSHGLEMDGDFHYNPSTGLLSVPGVSTSGNITIAGNLTVNGTTTTVATTNTTITDNLLELNSGAGSNANDCGILIERGSTGDNAIIAWDESNDTFKIGTTTSTNTATGDLTISTGTLVAALIGDVTGNASGSSGSCTGNAATATTATNISANANNGNDETVYPTFIDGVTGSQGIETDSGLTYNPSSGLLTSTGFAGALTGNVTGNCSGSSGSCTGNAATATSATNAGGITGTPDITVDDITAASLDISGDADIDGTLEADAYTVNGTALNEYIADTVGAMVGSNTESGITVTYEDGDNTLDFSVGTLNQNTSGTAGGLSGSPNITVGTIGCGAITGTAGVSDSKGNLRTIPQLSKSSAHTIVSSDSGKHSINSSGGWVFNTSTGFGAGEAITLINNSGSDQTVTNTGATMYLAGDTSAKSSLTLSGRGVATFICTASNVYYGSGAGLA